ncbi:hypothetical protein F5Y15DRAFT_337829 [Xylariaceae sp. FL0016]|nr:hypothetical protein F5Y15DRAFT_337829 [Xylariaceae sp. FL0016]
MRRQSSRPWLRHRDKEHHQARHADESSSHGAAGSASHGPQAASYDIVENSSVEQGYHHQQSSTSRLHHLEALHTGLDEPPSQLSMHSEVWKSHGQHEEFVQGSRMDEHYREATLHAEAELSGLISKTRDDFGESVDADTFREVIEYSFRSWQNQSEQGESSTSAKREPDPALERTETFPFIEKPSDLELHRPTAVVPPNHTCSWRDRYIALTSEIRLLKAEMSSQSVQNSEIRTNTGQEHHDTMADQEDDLGIQGVTIIMHLQGKDDIVINTDLTQEFETSG